MLYFYFLFYSNSSNIILFYCLYYLSLELPRTCSHIVTLKEATAHVRSLTVREAGLRVRIRKCFSHACLCPRCSTVSLFSVFCYYLFMSLFNLKGVHRPEIADVSMRLTLAETDPLTRVQLFEHNARVHSETSEFNV